MAAGGWVLTLAVAPLLPPGFSAVVYGFGGVICHQLPERSFHLFGAQLPVCARCVGIYAGAFLGWALVSVVQTPWIVALARDVRLARAGMVAAALPTVGQVVLEQSYGWTASNASRASAGAVLGMGVALVVGAVATLHWRRESSRPLR